MPNINIPASLMVIDHWYLLRKIAESRQGGLFFNATIDGKNITTQREEEADWNEWNDQKKM